MQTLSDVIVYIKEFGLKIFMSKFIRKCFYKSNSKLAWKINDYNEKLIEKYLEKQFNNAYIDMEVYLSFKNRHVVEEPIWVMWWQGEENAPEIVRCCINSVRRNCNGHEVIVISQSNVAEYVKLPEFIYEKLERDGISKTHLSDLIRLNLLFLYGGAWIDATVLVSQPIPQDLFEKKFYSCKFGVNTKDPSHGRWTTFLLFSKKGNVFLNKILEYHYKYWVNHNVYVDYIMFDYIINFLIKQNQNFYNQILSIPLNNKNVFELDSVLNIPISNCDFDSSDKNTIFYKLSYKHNLIKEKDGIKTVYGMLLEDYL